MPAFEYHAERENGEQVSSIAYGKSPEEVTAYLQNLGLRVTSISAPYRQLQPVTVPSVAQSTPVPVAPPVVSTKASAPRRNPILTHVLGPIVGKVSLRDQSFFFRQFAAMMEAGVPIVQCLDTLASQQRSGKFRKVLFEMRDAAHEGKPPSTTMARYPEVFSPLVMSLITAGEEGGFLAAALRQTSEYLDNEIELRNMYRRETIMPKLTVGASIFIILGANLIIAAVATPGSNAQTLASPLTNAETWKVLAPALILLFLWFRVGLAFEPLRRAWHMFALLIPYLGKTLHHFAMAKFGRAFAALYKGGVPITRTIELSADACGNEYLRSRIRPAAHTLEGGAGIHKTLAETRAFSPIVLNMVATGETTGNMDQMLTKMSEYYEEEGKVRSKQLASIVGVIAIIAIGVYVLFVLVSFYTSYFNRAFEAVEGA